MDIGQILVTAGISAGTSTLVGAIVRLSVERKFVQAAALAEGRKAKRIRFEELKCSWIWAAGRVLYHLVRWAQGRQQPNGDLDNSYARLEGIETELKSMERGYAAEAQEE